MSIMVRHDTCWYNYTAVRRLVMVVGFWDQPLYCNQPYYPTAKFDQARYTWSQLNCFRTGQWPMFCKPTRCQCKIWSSERIVANPLIHSTQIRPCLTHLLTHSQTSCLWMRSTADHAPSRYMPNNNTWSLEGGPQSLCEAEDNADENWLTTTSTTSLAKWTNWRCQRCSLLFCVVMPHYSVCRPI